MSKTAFFVFGTEGSGTYMLAEAFVSAGCFYDDELRESVPDDFPNKVVARLSVPCAGKFIDPAKTYIPYLNAGYDVFSCIIFRDVNASRESVKRRSPEKTDFDMWEEYLKAMKLIATILANSVHVNYEAFVGNAGYRKWLFNFYGLDEPKGEWFNANEKYYG